MGDGLRKPCSAFACRMVGWHKASLMCTGLERDMARLTSSLGADCYTCHAESTAMQLRR